MFIIKLVISMGYFETRRMVIDILDFYEYHSVDGQFKYQ